MDGCISVCVCVCVCGCVHACMHMFVCLAQLYLLPVILVWFLVASYIIVRGSAGLIL